jgi:hypothetical protein
MIIYKHIPRTAGNSIKEILPEGILFLGHDYYNINYKHLFYHVQKYTRCFVFAIVRNPYERAVSAFFYLNSGGNNPLDEIDQKKYIEKYHGDFEYFINYAFPEILQQIHFMPQWQWIYWNDVALCDEVNKFEDLSQYAMPQLNKSKHKKYEEYYNKKTKNIIYKYYRKDFELFDYKR